MREWCCVCPAYVGMSHATNLQSREFYQMMVTDVVVAKIFSHEWVVTKNWVANGWSHVKFTTPVARVSLICRNARPHVM